MNNILKIIGFTTMMLCANQVMAWGAIAVDHEQSAAAGYGTSVGEASKEAAASVALTNCRSSVNKNCTVVVRFETCGAYAASANNYGVGWGVSQSVAENMALSECGDSSCKIEVFDCE